MILISACLLGDNCKYNGDNNLNNRLVNLLEDMGLEDKLKPICPEVAGGLPIPRPPAEIIEGDGADVLVNNASVINKKGKEITDCFLAGVEEICQKLDLENIDFAILKARSPSCGSSQIYSGKFNGDLKKGEGVMAAFLRRHEIKVYSEEELDKVKKEIIQDNLT